MLHPAEYFCERTLSRFPRAKEQEAIFLRERAEFAEYWPDWCGLPMAATYAILSGGRTLKSLSQSRLLPDLTAALLWTRAKVAYRFDRDIAQALLEQEIDPTHPLPMEIFYQLPHFCIYVEERFAILDSFYDGFFTWMEFDAKTRVPELRLLFISQRKSYSVIVPFSEDRTLAGSISKLTIPVPAQYADAIALEEAAMRIAYAEAFPALQLVLYLCSDGADIPEPEASSRIAHQGEHIQRSTRPTATIDVGYRVGAAFRAAKSASTANSATQSEPSGKHVSPHVRRAHWHSFWSGPLKGERRISVRWLHPMLVGARDAEELKTVIHPVKSEKKGT